MALYEQELRDGIQLANGQDYCMKCYRPGSTIPADHSIEYQEVFKLHFNGLSYSLCLKHLQEVLGDYVLVHKDSLKAEDVLEIPKDLIENGTEQEVIDFIKKAAVK